MNLKSNPQFIGVTAQDLAPIFAEAYRQFRFLHYQHLHASAVLEALERGDLPEKAFVVFDDLMQRVFDADKDGENYKELNRPLTSVRLAVIRVGIKRQVLDLIAMIGNVNKLRADYNRVKDDKHASKDAIEQALREGLEAKTKMKRALVYFWFEQVKLNEKQEVGNE